MKTSGEQQFYSEKQCSFKHICFGLLEKIQISFNFQITKMDTEKMALLTSFLVDFLEYLRASEGDKLMHKKVSSVVGRSKNPWGRGK